MRLPASTLSFSRILPFPCRARVAISCSCYRVFFSSHLRDGIFPAKNRCVVTSSSPLLTMLPPRSAFREDDFGDSSDSDEDDTSGMKLPWVMSPTMRQRRGGSDATITVSDSSDDERGDNERSFGANAKTTTLYGRTIPAWSPGIRGRAARTREVLAVARNAREQAKENEFLRLRVRELENENGVHAEILHAAQQEARASHTELRQREVSLLAECAAHEASALQLEEELERMRAIEEQSAVEAMHLIQKMSRLQTELAGANRRVNIAEEMLVGFQFEGDKIAADAERWRLEAERVESEQMKQTELEQRHTKAMKELADLRDENALMRADIHALHSGMEAQLRAESEVGGGVDNNNAENTLGAGTSTVDSNEEDETFGTPIAAEGPSTPKGSPAKNEFESPRGHQRSNSDGQMLLEKEKEPTGPGPSKGDGVIFLRGRAVRVEGMTSGAARERPPPPHRSGWASPARSSFAKKMLAQFEKSEGTGRTPFRSLSQPHIAVANGNDVEGE